MSNRYFLPDIGLSRDFVNAINVNFTLISSHAHGSAPYQSSQIMNDAVNWVSMSLGGAIRDTKSIVLNNREALFSNSLFTKNGDLYYRKDFSPIPIDIQITTRSFLNFTVTIFGVGGDFSGFNVSLFFDTTKNSYTFTSNLGFLNIYCQTITLDSLDCLNLTCPNVFLLDAPVVVATIGSAYFDTHGQFTYFKDFIKNDDSIRPLNLVFDNLTTFSRPPKGDFSPTTYPVITDFLNFPTIQGGTPSGCYQGVWFPIISNGNLSMFFGQTLNPSATGLNYGIPDFIVISTASTQDPPISVTKKVRRIYNLSPKGVDAANIDTFKVNHYQTHLYDVDTGIDFKKYITSWNDFLILNITTNTSHTGPLYENFLYIDLIAEGIPSNIDFTLYHQISFLYDAGPTPV